MKAQWGSIFILRYKKDKQRQAIQSPISVTIVQVYDRTPACERGNKMEYINKSIANYADLTQTGQKQTIPEEMMVNGMLSNNFKITVKEEFKRRGHTVVDNKKIKAMVVNNAFYAVRKADDVGGAATPGSGPRRGPQSIPAGSVKLGYNCKRTRATRMRPRAGERRVEARARMARRQERLGKGKDIRVDGTERRARPWEKV